MLFYNTIEPAALELLKNLQEKILFSDLRLVGGTSLALQYGHRISVDIDLFGKIDTDEIEIASTLKKCGEIQKINVRKNIYNYTVNNIKVDIVNYPFHWLRDFIETDGIKLAQREDIIAMKLSAVTNRGTKKDFIDIFFLLKEYSLDEMMNLYADKYQDSSGFLVLKSLVYFDDADDDPMPLMLKEIDWQTVKRSIKEEVRRYSLE